MISSNTLRAIWLAAAISLLSAAPALAAPAGDEYLPGEPSATGDSGDGSGSGSGSGSDGSSGSDEDKGGGAAGSGKDGGTGSGGSGPDGISVENASTSEDTGGLFDTLFDPIVLLLIAGVATAAVGMTLRHRQGLTEVAGGAPTPRNPATAPHTPDGEILGGGGEGSPS